MIIKKAEFTVSAVSPAQYPAAGQPEIALVGRSNVGKSSLINRFLNRKNLARTSSQPGKTQTLNFYHINEDWYFVDLPGYGYAKASKQLQSAWASFIDEYLHKRFELTGVIMIVDLRHPPSQDDVSMFKWLEQSDLPFLLIATKADKISRGQWHKHQKVVAQGLKESSVDLPVVVFSALSGVGLAELEAWVEARLAAYQPQIKI